MEIITTRKNKILVDPEDYPILSRWTWSETKIYPYTKISGATIYMHRLIMGSPTRKNFEIDHINGNKRDNRKENLRWCTHTINLAGRPRQKNNTSGFKGVTWDKKRNKWVVQVAHKFIGRFIDRNKAIEARIIASKKHYGEEIYNG